MKPPRARFIFALFTMLGLALVTTWVSGGARAAEFVELNESVRGLGMGDAYSAVATGHDALLYNPAGLARNHGFSWEIVDFQLGADGSNAYQTYQNFTASGSYVTALHNFFGQQLFVGANAKTSVTLGNFAFSYFDNGYLSANLSNPALPSFNINLVNDNGFAAGVGFDLGPGISWGISGRRVNRFGSNVPIGFDTLFNLNSTQLQNQLNNQGVGYGLDTGFLFSLPGAAKPTLSFAWKDVGVTTFKPLTAVAPPPQLDNMVIGFGAELEGFLFTLRPSIEVQHLNDPTEQLGKKMHAGVELSLPLIDLRAGISQGYYTAGVGLDVGFIRLDAATYGVERGVYPGQDGDRRYIVQAILKLSFDPNFNFLNTKGKKAAFQRR